MNWSAFHHRTDVLRSVIDEADLRRDGHLPMQLSGVTETFHDELDLIGALQLRWHTRLAGTIERHLFSEGSDDLESVVRRAWLATAEELPGIRVVLDRQLAAPATPEVASALARAAAKERVLLALTAGRVGAQPGLDPRAVEIGRRIEEAARASYRPAVPMPATAATVTRERPEPTVGVTGAAIRVPSGSAAFVARLKAALAA